MGKQNNANNLQQCKPHVYTEKEIEIENDNGVFEFECEPQGYSLEFDAGFFFITELLQ